MPSKVIKTFGVVVTIVTVSNWWMAAQASNVIASVALSGISLFSSDRIAKRVVQWPNLDEVTDKYMELGNRRVGVRRTAKPTEGLPHARRSNRHSHRILILGGDR